MLACAPAEPKAFSSADERAIRHVDSLYVAAWLRDDTAAVLRTLAPDAVMPAGQRPLATPNDIREFWWPTDGSRTKILTFYRVIDEIAGDANLASVRGTDTLTFTYDKGRTHQPARQSLHDAGGLAAAAGRLLAHQPDDVGARVHRSDWPIRAGRGLAFALHPLPARAFSVAR